MLRVGAITLRAFSAGDLEALALMRQILSVELAAQSTLPYPTPLETFRRRLEEGSTAVSSGRGGDLEFAIALSNDPLQPAIGVAGLYAFDGFNSIAEVGIMIGNRRHWGRGLGFHALVALYEFAFRHANLNRVYTHIKADNRGVIRLARRLGMSEEGLLREHRWKSGKYIDVVAFGLLRRDWDFGALEKKYNLMAQND